jgi:hypothetical protein
MGGAARAIEVILVVTPRCLGGHMSQHAGYEDGPDDDGDGDLDLDLEEEALDPVGALSYDDDADAPE